MTRSISAASGAPALLWRRGFAWWLVQVKHVLTPTMFFLFGFNLIFFMRWMTLEEYGIPFTNFFAASLAALLVGKPVLVVDNLPFMHRFDGAPLIQPYPVQVNDLLGLRVPPRQRTDAFLARRRGSWRFPDLPRRAIRVAALSGDPDLTDGAVPCLRDGSRAQYTVRRRRAPATVRWHSSEAKLTTRQRIRLLTRLDRLTTDVSVEVISENGSAAHTELFGSFASLRRDPPKREFQSEAVRPMT